MFDDLGLTLEDPAVVQKIISMTKKYSVDVSKIAENYFKFVDEMHRGESTLVSKEKFAEFVKISKAAEDKIEVCYLIIRNLKTKRSVSGI